MTNKLNPQDEIWIRGPSIIKRYYENKELTNEIIAPRGWFITSDIREQDTNRLLKVIN